MTQKEKGTVWQWDKGTNETKGQKDNRTMEQLDKGQLNKGSMGHWDESTLNIVYSV